MSIATVLDKDSVRNLVLPLSVEQYHRMDEIGLISPKTELIEGIIIRKMTKYPLHAYLLHVLYDFFSARIPADYLVRKEDPLTLATSEPEPDLAIVKGTVEDFKTTHPNQAELVIEVAIASLDLDRKKTEIYATAGINEYWIVIPAEKKAEVYSKPVTGKYKNITIYGEDESINTRYGSLDLRLIFG
ncbi:MAG: Uma2 family endonuclease [Candidatus Competibacteraceae bacterium]